MASPNWDDLYKGYVMSWVRAEIHADMESRRLLMENAKSSKMIVHNVIRDNLLKEMQKARGPGKVGKISSYGMVRHYDKFVHKAVHEAQKEYGIMSKGYVKNGKHIRGYVRSFPTPWSSDEVGFLTSHQDWSMKRLAKHFKRTASSISTKLYRLR